MINIDNGSVSDFFSEASFGPLMTAQIISLTGNGKLKVNCNWLYSALNCNPTYNESASWLVTKVNNYTVNLSPQPSCISQQIYASVRPDYNYHVQVQAPFSADWIVQAQADEMLEFKLYDLSIASFKGINEQYMSAANESTSHDGLSGHLVVCNNATFNKNSQWFLQLETSLQPNLKFSGQKFDQEATMNQAASINTDITEAEYKRIATQLGI